MTDNVNNPKHIAIIMDGNGRWAKSKNLPVYEGHKQGAEAARKLVKNAIEMGINYLTLYTFSSENWSRPEEEVEQLTNLLEYYLDNEAAELIEEGCKINFIGEIEDFGQIIYKKCLDLQEKSKDNNKINIVIALNYGSRQEIKLATQKLIEASLNTHDLRDFDIRDFLQTSNFPDPDLLIRTGGEQRLSNFLLWQLAYTELYFTKVLWPDFDLSHLEQALQDYQNRDRRFGGRSS
jgi:undecaprenyl diphosphate synthase